MIGVQDISKLQELCNWCDCGYWDEMFVAPFYQLSTYKLVDAQHEFKVLRAHVCIFRIQRTCCFCLDLTASSSLWLCSPAQCLGEIRPKNQENWQALSLSLSRSFAPEIQAVAFVLQISEVSALSNRFALLCPPPFLLSIVVQECQGMGQKKTLLALLMAH